MKFDALKKFENVTLGVVGDIMLDHSLMCEIERISPEAPVPVARVVGERYVPGGAGNAAANIASLGGRADIIGVLGDDAPGKILREELQRRGVNTEGIIEDPSYGTIQKIRVIAQGQQIARIDRENAAFFSPSFKKSLSRMLASRISHWTGLIVSDYEKGLYTPAFALNLVRLAQRRKIPVIVNTKPKNFPFFRGADVFVPNKREAEGVLGRKFLSDADVRKGGFDLAKRFGAHIVMTRGAEGITLFSEKKMHHVPARAQEVFDVTGASDTVVAVFSLAYVSGFSLKDAAHLANFAAGIVVGKRGTATVSREELKNMYA